MVEHSLSAIRDLFRRHVAPSDVAAVFVEPMLGEGGYVVPPDAFLVGLRELCSEHDIVLVFDEIQTGVGRTGRMWAAEHSGVQPDVLLAGKGLASGMPLGAIVAKASLMRWGRGSHGSTYGGNPVACAAALATLDLVEGGLAENARVVGARMLEALEDMRARAPRIADVRGRGLFIGVELGDDPSTGRTAAQVVDDTVQAAFRRGLLLLGCGEGVIRLCPPLVLDEQDAHTGLALIETCLVGEA